MDIYSTIIWLMLPIPHMCRQTPWEPTRQAGVQVDAVARDVTRKLADTRRVPDGQRHLLQMHTSVVFVHVQTKGSREEGKSRTVLPCH